MQRKTVVYEGVEREDVRCMGEMYEELKVS